MARSTGSHQRIACTVRNQIGTADVCFVDPLPLRAVITLQLRRRLRSVQPLKPLRGIFRGDTLLNRVVQIYDCNLRLRDHIFTSLEFGSFCLTHKNRLSVHIIAIDEDDLSCGESSSIIHRFAILIPAIPNVIPLVLVGSICGHILPRGAGIAHQRRLRR